MSKLAVVSGASTGIGFELAHCAAKSGYDLVVAANEPQIHAAARHFQQHGVDVTAIETDLATISGVDRMMEAIEGRPVDVLCANAGAGTGGPFLSVAVDDWRHSIDTNVTGTLYLLQRVLTDMTARRDGKVLVTGSIAGYIPGTLNSVYNATKAFIDNFTDALRNELKDHDGVTLTTLLPGATDTEFFARAGMAETNVGKSDHKDDPAKVARDGWEAMLAGRDRVTSGLHNKLQVAASGVVPPAILAAVHRKLAEPG